jgi:RNA polymerase subunit RPABC4/transcription elongation factor Spt4
MTKKKACKKCKSLFMGTKCPKCGSEEATDTFKGKVVVLDAEQSEIAKNMKLKEKGEYAIKT